MTDEQVEKIIKRNMNLQMNLAGIRSDFQEALHRQWVGLTDEEIEAIRLETGYAAGSERFTKIARAIEAAHGIKGEA